MVVIPPNTIDQPSEYLRPQTSTEQYWAIRALKAETILQARTVHHRELQSLSFSEQTKRSREIAALSQAHEAKQVRLEKFVIALLACLGFLIMAFIYLLTSRNRNEPSASRRSLPYHFTIPILSPFTSVVEHETSAIGTRSIAVLVMTLAVLVYFIFRRWMMRTGAVA
ncbi:hypothetical protein PILCRDRAFT_820182 [Piloderma croceum F 1598]|uniref:Uncharacterized protein n=1 Tax=Piloderma croceum (strain F 1598) TaxID=765440 RepID=A0A0C3FWP4_PILCF|nr:hypothetical protein PILCRDRAFT_820182 [Piloderma croceum F 1598]